MRLFALRLLAVLAAFSLIGCFGQSADGQAWRAHLQRGIELRGDTSMEAAERFALAEQEYRTALAKLEHTLGEEPVAVDDVRELFNELESLLRTVSKHEELPEVITKRLNLFEDLLGPDNMLVATSSFNLASTYEKLGQVQQAAEAYERARQTYARLGRTRSVAAMERRIRALTGRAPAPMETATAASRRPRGEATAAGTEQTAEARLPTTAYDRLAPPLAIVRKAIDYGRTATAGTTEFGSVDFGLNRVAIDEAAYVRLLTPFVNVATVARQKGRKGGTLPDQEVDRARRRPLEIHLMLDVAPAAVEESISAHLRAAGTPLDLSNQRMEASFCDDSSGRCQRAIAYRVLPRQLGRARSFQLVFASPSLGRETVDVDLNQMW